MAEQLDPSELASFKELMMASSIQVDTMAQLLIEKGIFTNDGDLNNLKVWLRKGNPTKKPDNEKDVAAWMKLIEMWATLILLKKKWKRFGRKRIPKIEVIKKGGFWYISITVYYIEGGKIKEQTKRWVVDDNKIAEAKTLANALTIKFRACNYPNQRDVEKLDKLKLPPE